MAAPAPVSSSARMAPAVSGTAVSGHGPPCGVRSAPGLSPAMQEVMHSLPLRVLRYFRPVISFFIIIIILQVGKLPSIFNAVSDMLFG